MTITSRMIATGGLCDGAGHEVIAETVLIQGPRSQDGKIIGKTLERNTGKGI